MWSVVSGTAAEALSSRCGCRLSSVAWKRTEDLQGIRCVAGQSGKRSTGAPGFAEADAEWRRVSKSPYLRAVGRWETLSDRDVGGQLAGAAGLERWWDLVDRACPLVVSPAAERVLCDVRRHFVRLLATNPASLPEESSGRLLRLARVLGMQAQQSEYAYVITREEENWARALPLGVAPQWRSIAEALLTAFPSTQSGSELVTDSPDTVQRFYERHVFPRWSDLSPWNHLEALAQPLREAGRDGKTLLVAGCGTGRWACHFASSFPGVSVLAVDVSQASLSFAEEQKQRFGLQNITFEHADLRSWTTDRKFDFIECGGVLHHLEDPVAAWARLVSTLAHDGAMLVALYSRMARWPLKQMRKDVLRAIFPSTGKDNLSVSLDKFPDDDTLRSFRRELLARTWKPELMPLASSLDFHSLSRLRDCFFHPLEHEYTLLEVEEMLQRLGLKFMGFEGVARPSLLRKHLGARANPLDLRAWHALEERMPGLFLGMYRLFVRRDMIE